MDSSAFTIIEAASLESAFADNGRPKPSKAQCLAGNYRVGRVSIHGLPVAIEQPRGSVREGVDKAGKRWACRMAAHYGYFVGTKGADGDGVDVFVGPDVTCKTAYIINQFEGGRFDEHKVVLGATDEAHARRIYLNSYERGWRGLESIVAVSIPQLKKWLKGGAKRRAVAAEHINQEGNEPVNRVFWNSEAMPEGVSLDQVIYQLRHSDGDDGLLLDAASIAEIVEDSEGAIALDAMVFPVNLLARKMEVVRTIMERTGNTVKPLNMQISEPFKQRGVTNIAAVVELSDGQTVSIYFHNPDTTPNKLKPTDDMISWKWLLNKKDITIVVAPERGEELNPREVARRVIRLAEKNSAAFQRANAKRAERMGNIQSLKAEIAGLEKELSKAQRDLEVEQIMAEDRLASAGDAQTLEIDDGAIGASISEWKRDGDESLSLAVERYISEKLQGRYIQTVIGKVLFNAVSKGELSLGTPKNELRAALIPFVPQTLKRGAYQGREPLTKLRKDKFVAFHKFAGEVLVAGYKVQHIVSVGERENGEFVFVAYHSKGEGATLITRDSVSNDMVGRSQVMAAPSCVIMDAAASGVNSSDDGWNIQILRVWNKDGVELEPETLEPLQAPGQSDENALTNSAQNWMGFEHATLPNGTIQLDYKHPKVGRMVFAIRPAGGGKYQAQYGTTSNKSLLLPDVQSCIQWAANVRDSVLTAAEVKDAEVVLTGNELGDFADTPEGLKALRKAAKGALLALRGEWVDVPALKDDAGNIRKVEIRKRGINEFLHFGANPDKLRMAAAIKLIIQSAKSPKWEANIKLEKKAAVSSYLRMENTVSISGRPLNVTVLIEQDQNGLLHYDLLLPEKAKAALDSSTALRSELIPNHKSGVPDSGERATFDDVGQGSGRMVINLFIEGEAPEYAVEGEAQGDESTNKPLADSDKIAAVDAAYLFANASDEFKLWMHGSIDEKDYSPFLTAKAMDEAAKRNGASIEWGEFEDVALDSAEEDDDAADFDEVAEWGAMPEEDEEGATLDGDFPGHPFRGNQYRKAGRESGAAVSASIRAKRAARRGSAKEVRSAHRVAHHAHTAAAFAATSKGSRKYHRKMARFHGKNAGLKKAALDSAVLFDGVLENGYNGKIMKGGAIVGRVEIGGDGKAMVFIGASGDERVKGREGRPFMYSNDDAADMVDALFAGLVVATSQNGPYKRKAALELLIDLDMHAWLSESQKEAVVSGLGGEEWKFFADKMRELSNTIKTMPKTYEQDGNGNDTVAYVHYFRRSADWYITEKDKEGYGTEQAFGLADIGYGSELGYISVDELVSNGVELDMHWKPKTLWQIRGNGAEPEPEDKGSLASFGKAANAIAKMEAALAGSVWGDAIRMGKASNYQGGYLMDITMPDGKTIHASYSTTGFIDLGVKAESGPFPVKTLVQVDAEKASADDLREAIASAANKLHAIGGNDGGAPPAKNEGNEMLESDKALFQSVIDGKAEGMLTAELADTLEAAYLRHESDPVMAGLFEQAVNAYTAAMLAATADL